MAVMLKMASAIPTARIFEGFSIFLARASSDSNESVSYYRDSCSVPKQGISFFESFSICASDFLDILKFFDALCRDWRKIF